MSRRGLARLNAKRDANERPVIDLLEAHGFVVTPINGKGVPDLLVGKWGRSWLLEVKAPKGKLTEAQQKWRDRWKGSPPVIVRNEADAQQFIANCLSL